MRARVGRVGLGPARGQHVQSRLRMVRVLEVPLRAHAEPGDRRVGVGAEQLTQLALPPHVVAALDALRVGVERRVEAALGPAHLAERPAQRAQARLQVARLAARLPGVQVGPREQRVVIEHLLEVGHRPGRVDAVAREAARELVVDAARGDLIERRARDVALAAQQQELDHRGLRELRRRPEAAEALVVDRAQVLDGAVQIRLADGLLARLEPAGAGELFAQAVGALADLLAVLLPGLRDRLQDLGPGRHAMTRLRGEVGAAVERDLLGREEDVERPAAATRHPLHGLHVERVDVRALLAVDLHADEVLVHHRRRRRVLEGLPLHHVAPVAGGVADRHEHRHVARGGVGERLLAPRPPVDRVLGVLEQVGRGLPREGVGHREKD